MTDHSQCGDECFLCRIRSVSVSPSAMPSRMNQISPRTPNPAWERGVPTDSRGMPYLDAQGQPMGQKKVAENRSLIEKRKRELANT